MSPRQRRRSLTLETGKESPEHPSTALTEEDENDTRAFFPRTLQQHALLHAVVCKQGGRSSPQSKALIALFFV